MEATIGVVLKIKERCIKAKYKTKFFDLEISLFSIIYLIYITNYIYR